MAKEVIKVEYQILIKVTDETQGRRLHMDIEPSYVYLEDVLSTLERATEHCRALSMTQSLLRGLAEARQQQNRSVVVPDA